MIPINRPDVSLKDIWQFIKPDTTVSDLELFFSEWLGGGKYCLMTSSGKIAIYLLFKFLGIQGNVVTTPLTCTMALKPIIANGVPLRFADVTPHTFNLDVASLDKTINEHTRAIYLVHLGGLPNNMDEILEIANVRNLLVIEDCAQALGSTYQGARVGCFGDFAIFSFSKNIWLTGGGMICTDNFELLNRIRDFQNQLPEVSQGLLGYRLKRDLIESGRGKVLIDALYHHKFCKPGKNANVNIDLNSYFQEPHVLHKPSSLQASVIRHQLLSLGEKNRKRRANAHYFQSLLKSHFSVQEEEFGRESVYSKFYLLTNETAGKMIPFLVSRGIDAKQLTKSHGIYLQPRFDQDALFGQCETIHSCVTYLDIHDRIVALPISSKMAKSELDYSASVLKQHCA